jgi:drug/metabolite transporter (DMT)-like permease
MRLLLLTTITMLAFAANSILCRVALAEDHIGAASFTLIRIVSGAVFLSLLVVAKSRSFRFAGSWLSGGALFGYAAAFSFAYINLSAATGALLLFAAVQATMIAYGLWSGERLCARQIMGITLAFGGLVWLMLPGIEAPPLVGTIIMLISGACWGLYSLLGRQSSEPTIATTGNFLRAIPFALLLFLILGDGETASNLGLVYAVASGALASGLGYALWYLVLPQLAATSAATIQLSVPIIAALGGVLLLDEAISLRFTLASIAVLGGISLFILSKQRT